MSRSARALGALLAPILLVGFHARCVAWQAGTTSAWYGLYMNGAKIGSTHLLTVPVQTSGRSRTRIEAKSAVKLEMMGTTVRQDSSVVTICDERMRPVTQEHVISSGGSEIKVSAKYATDRVVCTVSTGATTSRRIVAVPKGADLVANSTFFGSTSPARPGDRRTVYYLNPLTITLDKAELTIEARERLSVAGETWDTLRTVAVTPLGRIVSWDEPTQGTVAAELPLGMRMYRMTEEAARASDTPEPEVRKEASAPATGGPDIRPPADFALATAVQLDVPITDPRQVRRLVLSIGGIPRKSLVLSDDRQRVLADPDAPGRYRYTITTTAATPARSARALGAAAPKSYLSDAPYLDLANPEIKALARRLRDPKGSPRTTAERIHAWVHKNMVADYGIGVPRPASDILKRKRGVCRDYATLFASLARSAGVPTRLVSGIVYADGRFFYHAWVECFVGPWRAYDATLPALDVDATHVKFAQGDPAEMLRVYEVIGKLDIRVVQVGP